MNFGCLPSAAAGGGAGGGAVSEEPDEYVLGPDLRGAVCPKAQPARRALGAQQVVAELLLPMFGHLQ